MDTKELLTAVNKGGIEGEGDVGGFKQLKDIVFLALIFKLNFILKVKGGLGVPVDIEVKEVAYLGIKADLYVLVKVEPCLTAAVGIKVAPMPAPTATVWSLRAASPVTRSSALLPTALCSPACLRG